VYTNTLLDCFEVFYYRLSLHGEHALYLIILLTS